MLVYRSGDEMQDSANLSVKDEDKVDDRSKAQNDLNESHLFVSFYPYNCISY